MCQHGQPSLAYMGPSLRVAQGLRIAAVFGSFLPAVGEGRRRSRDYLKIESRWSLEKRVRSQTYRFRDLKLKVCNDLSEKLQVSEKLNGD